MKWLKGLMAPSYDRLVNQANRHVSLRNINWHAGNFAAAKRHRDLANALFEQAKRLKP